MQSQPQNEYPFRSLPTAPYRPTLGMFLVVIGKTVLPIFFITYLLYFFLIWVPELLSDSSDNTVAKFFIGFIMVVAVFFVRPFLAKLVERGNTLRQIDAISLLEKDQRSPILYLRSFGDDDLVDTTPPSEWLPVVNTYEVRFCNNQHQSGSDR